MRGRPSDTERAGWKRPSGTARQWAALAASVILSTLASSGWNLWKWVVNDDYFHIVTGRWILSNGFPSADFFSWMSPVLKPPLVAHQWLYQVTVSCLYSVGGFFAMQGLNILFCLGIFALVALLALRRSGSFRAASVSVLLVGTLLSLDYMAGLQTRPQTGAIFFLLAAMAFLERGGSGRWPYLLLVVAGANWHGGFWPLFALVVLYYSVRERDWWLLPGVLAVLLNPYGVQAMLVTATFAGDAASLAAVSSEWQRTVFWPMAHSGLVPFLCAATALIGTYLARPRWEDLGLVSALLVLSLAGFRFVILIPLLAVPVLAAYWKRMGDGIPTSWVLRLPDPVRLRLPAVPALLLVAVMAFTSGLWYAAPRSWAPQEDLEHRTVSPRTAGLNDCLDYIESRKLDRVLNTSIDDGGYMAFYGVQPLIDNRADVYLYRQRDGSSIWSEMSRAWSEPQALDGMVRKYGAEWVLDKEDEPASPNLSPYLRRSEDRYRLAYHSGYYGVYEVLEQPDGGSAD